MIKKSMVVKVNDKTDAMPIAMLVQVASQYESSIYVDDDSKRVNAKSIMGIMAFNPSDGMSVDIVTEGAYEEAALDAIEKFLVCE